MAGRGDETDLTWAILLVLAGPRIGAADLLIRNARLLDGTGAPPRDGVSILVRGERIAAIGTDVGDPGVPKRAVDAHGGRITASRAPGAGMTFAVELPIGGAP